VKNGESNGIRYGFENMVVKKTKNTIKIKTREYTRTLTDLTVELKDTKDRKQTSRKNAKIVRSRNTRNVIRNLLISKIGGLGKTRLQKLERAAIVRTKNQKVPNQNIEKFEPLNQTRV